MRAATTSLFMVAASVLPLSAQTLDIYFIDVEGGQATLYVSPSGESMLVDTGFPNERDHGRIMEVFDLAGVERIDHLVLTHYHLDHYGGLEALANRLPIENYYDHGRSVEGDRPPIQEFEAKYAEIRAEANRTVVQPGDRIPFGDLDVLVVTSHGEFLDSPIAGAPGAGDANPACAGFTQLPESAENDPDNHASVGFVMTYGRFRTINLGDFTWNLEGRLMCPNNPIGTVDLYLTSHHGLNRSGSAVLVHGVRPRAAIMNNGPHKGGASEALEILHGSPGLEGLWQLHWSHDGGVEYNAPGAFIANVDEPATLARAIDPGDGDRVRADGDHSPAHWIKVSAEADGTFTVTNSRNEFSRTYRASSR